MKSRRFNPSPRPHAAEWIFEPTPVATSRMKGLQPSSDFPGYALEIPEAPGLHRGRVLHGEKEKFRLDVSFGTAPRGKVQPFSRINPAPIKAWRLRLSDHPTVHHESPPTAIQQQRRP
jgi:hypothetical protein